MATPIAMLESGQALPRLRIYTHTYIYTVYFTNRPPRFLFLLQHESRVREAGDGEARDPQALRYGKEKCALSNWRALSQISSPRVCYCMLAAVVVGWCSACA